MLKHLRFQLSLDDPKLPQEEWLTLRGDCVQLEALHDAVSTYVQHFLEQSHNLETLHDRHWLDSVASSSAEAIAVLPIAVPNKTLAAIPNSKTIFLQPNGLLHHKLALGSLATSTTTPVVSLSMLQLFDLANALDDCASEMVVLPDLQRSRQSTLSSPRWGQLAATGLIVIGLSASVAKIIESSSKPASPVASESASSNDQPIATQSLPPIASGQKLPPPPPLGSTVPASPGLPTFPLASPLPSSSSVVKPPVGAITLKPNPNTRSSRKDAGNQIAMVPQESGSSAPARSRSQPVQPMPKPLALNREFANVPPSEPASAPTARSSGSDRGTQADQVGTAFDTIPQIAEARQYFQQRWHPPQGLTQTLEYTLLVSANGSIQRAVPLGQAAGDYVDRTGIPLAGEAFVSASSGGRNAKIRLVLSPDGSVKTFLEGFY